MTPRTGIAGAEVAGERAQHRPVSAEHESEVDVLDVAGLGLEAVLAASSSTMRSSTPDSRASEASRASAEPIASGLPCVTTAARATSTADGVTDPVVDVIQEHGVVAVDQVDEELRRSSPGSPESTTPTVVALQPSAASTTSRTTRC